MKNVNRDISNDRLSAESKQKFVQQAQTWEKLYNARATVEWIPTLSEDKYASVLTEYKNKRKLKIFLRAAEKPPIDPDAENMAEDANTGVQTKPPKRKTQDAGKPWSQDEVDFLIKGFKEHATKYDKWSQICDKGQKAGILDPRRNNWGMKNKWRSIFEKCQKATLEGRPAEINWKNNKVCISEADTKWIAEHGALLSRARGWIAESPEKVQA